MKLCIYILLFSSKKASNRIPARFSVLLCHSHVLLPPQFRKPCAQCRQRSDVFRTNCRFGQSRRYDHLRLDDARLVLMRSAFPRYFRARLRGSAAACASTKSESFAFLDTEQAIAIGARLHFMSLSGPDPHGLTEHEVASIHV